MQKEKNNEDFTDSIIIIEEKDLKKIENQIQIISEEFEKFKTNNEEINNEILQIKNQNKNFIEQIEILKTGIKEMREIRELRNYNLDEYLFKEKKIDFLNTIKFEIDSKKVYINSILLNEENLRQLKIGFLFNKNIEELCFTNSNIGDLLNKEKGSEALEKILSLIKSCKNLKSIIFNNEKLNENTEIINRIFCELSQLNNLTSIYLYDNNLGENIECMKVLSNFLKNNKRIELLSLSHNSLGLNSKDNLQLLYEGLFDNKNLKELYLSNNKFTTFDESFRLLAENFNGKSINLMGNKFNEEAKNEFRKINLNEKTKNIFNNF
jgi:hypothetical protein